MRGWLLDQGVLFELRKHRPDPRVRFWSDAQPQESLFLGIATLVAIRHHVERHCDAALQTEIGIWIDEVLRPWFGVRILPVNEEVVLEWRRILADEHAEGSAGRDRDLLLLATARVHGLTICTRDDHAYLDAGAEVFNPWNGRHP